MRPSRFQRRQFLQLLPFLCAAPCVRARSGASFSADQITVAGCSLPNHSFASAVDTLHDLGFAGLEIAVFADKGVGPDQYPWVVVDDLPAAERDALQAIIRRFSRVTAHLPYGTQLRPLAKDPAIRDASRRELQRALNDAAFWGAKLANIHVMSEPGVSFSAAKPELVALYRELGDMAARHGMQLAIETTRPYLRSEYLELVTSVARENVGGTVDTGHMHFFRSELNVSGADRITAAGARRYNDFLVGTIEALGPKLFHLHLDDLRVADWREHFVPGTGIIDWPRFFETLARLNYRSALTGEILYYQGADDTGALITRAFTQRTPAGAAEAGLKQFQSFMRRYAA